MENKVLLMGNGSSVLDKELGKRIDKEFDYVFRINRFRTKGYEKNVGAKVDGWFLADTGVQWLRNPIEEVEGSTIFNIFEYVYIVAPKFKFMSGEANACKDILSETIQLIPPTYEDELNKIKTIDPFWPTTGLVSINFLLSNFNKIFIYGFDSKSKKYKYIHYYDEGDETRLTERWHRPRKDHNIKIEKEIIDHYKNVGKIIYYE
jgi:hypothetical protein